MPTLVATASSASANSYVTVAEADTYFGERHNASNWTSASDDEKEQALIMATRRIEQERFEGLRTTEAQALKWPREGVVDEDGYEYANDAVPDIVKYATYELALRILNDGTTDTFADTGVEGYKRVKVGTIEVEKDESYRAGEFPETVKRWLRPVLRTSSMTGYLLRA